jgi:hypothetical protein
MDDRTRYETVKSRLRVMGEGAAQQVHDAMELNPYSVREVANTLDEMVLNEPDEFERIGETYRCKPTQSEPAASSTAPSTVPASGTIEVRSTPDGVEVYVDGAFIGNAPATLKLAPGQHTIRVIQSGFKEWSREIAVQSGSEAHLSATLDKTD